MICPVEGGTGGMCADAAAFDGLPVSCNDTYSSPMPEPAPEPMPEPAPEPMPAPATTPAPAPSAGSCVGEWQQCGGQDWTGPACCTAGLTCVPHNPWHSQCERATTSAPSTTAPATPAPTTPGPTTVPTPSPTTTPSSGSSCVGQWAKCGGQGWAGATCCTTGLECKFHNPWHSQCERLPSSSGCSGQWEQCGGEGWAGASCCDAGLTCSYHNSHYSQCVPETAALAEVRPHGGARGRAFLAAQGRLQPARGMALMQGASSVVHGEWGAMEAEDERTEVRPEHEEL